VKGETQANGALSNVIGRARLTWDKSRKPKDESTYDAHGDTEDGNKLGSSFLAVTKLANPTTGEQQHQDIESAGCE
jgi:hypothetical protein